MSEEKKHTEKAEGAEAKEVTKKAEAIKAPQAEDKAISSPQNIYGNEEFQISGKTLVPADVYLKAGVHIGTKFKSGDMSRYIYKQRRDGLKVMDIATFDEHLRIAANFIAQFAPERIAIVSRKLYGQKPVQEFAESIGARAFVARFVPGTFTNPEGKEFVEPQLVIANDPGADAQAISEATVMKRPVIAFCNTDSSLKNIDLAIPMNNKGRKSLALAYWILTREVLLLLNKIKSPAEFTKKVEDFEYVLKEGASESDEGEEGGRKKSYGRDRERGERREYRRREY
ncbi:MAG: 30S ribosomal protein S2 [Candidatus Diapherotrites archaeon]|uniref:Small ribosomal subunit protein uS2 n=1 Tax=Candidatus Iainarchaeum sp. TaxID=3101447 RepID=A0A8T4KSZ5_9ARCH|nr:30S ribosomal protein S2 [Candidatus Diapherotrites archaeon]